jgi:flagellar biosynthesis/type III secretory pathway chaperone
MDQECAQMIETLIEKEIHLYHELQHCLETEQKALIQVDMDSLWRISSQKEAVCKKIGCVKEQIASMAAPFCSAAPFDLHQLFALLPRNRMAALSDSIEQLSVLKKGIAKIKDQNMRFMNDSLEFIDEIMAIISGSGGKTGAAVYNRRCGFNHHKTVQLLRQEV